MFNLNPYDLGGESILDCAAGASSFTARMGEMGVDIKAIDLLYHKKPSYLKERCREHLNALVDALKEMESSFHWDFFKDLDDLKKIRMKTCLDFNRHYEKNREHYVKGDLTHIPFKEGTFSLVLCSHLLFIYDHRLSYDFHVQAVEDMLRVSSGEVRIYPLVKHGAQKSEYVNTIMDDLGMNADIWLEKVNYEFRRGAFEMMRIIKNK